MGREELGRLIEQEAREALRIVAPKIRPGAKAKWPGSGWKERVVPGPNVRSVPKKAAIKIPREPADPAKALIAEREAICARCECFNWVCALVFPQVKSCCSPNRYRAS